MTKEKALKEIERLERDKAQLKSKGEKLKATDSSQKIFLNTMAYGFLGWEYGMFNDYDEAERITKEGQRMIKMMNAFVEEDGGVVVKTDTDGTAFIMPPQYRGSQETEDEYCKVLTDRMPDGIIIEHDGRYKGMLAVDKKSYAMMEYDGKMKVKGNTLRGRNVEPFIAEMISSCIRHLLNGNEEKCTAEYQYWLNRIKNREMKPEELQSRKNLNMSLEEYKNRREAGTTNTLAQYEVAINSDMEYQKGDTILYYVTNYEIDVKRLKSGKLKVSKKKVPIFEVAKEIKYYDNDYEIDHYIKRLELGVKKFIILGKDMFERLFDVEVKAVDERKYQKVTGKPYKEV